jgi:hypothetical protein
VNHRHLLPDEIDLLVDGEVGFGVAPLRAHIAECDRCRAELDDARGLAETLDRLPHFAPSPAFAERVMSQVQVFEPWHVAARESARRWLPASGGLRAAAGFVAIGAGGLLTLATLWLVTRWDVFVYAAGLAAERTRVVAVQTLGDVVAAVFGPAALDALRAGGLGAFAMGLALLVATAVLTTLALRRVVTVAARRRG